MDIFVLILTFLAIGVSIIVVKKQSDTENLLYIQSQLSKTVQTAYIAAFNSPHDEQVIAQYTDAIHKLVTHISGHEKALPASTAEIEQKKIDAQQLAISLHKAYLDKLSSLHDNPANNLLLTTWLNDGAALSAHLKTSTLENASHFAATHVLHIADIRRERYQHALNALKHNPTNPDLHTHALQMGREYAESTRAEGVVTLFDETALANDIRAVTANAAQVSTIDNTQSRPAQAASLDERIAALLKLKAAGLLSDAEFEQKRQALIDAV